MVFPGCIISLKFQYSWQKLIEIFFNFLKFFYDFVKFEKLFKEFGVNFKNFPSAKFLYFSDSVLKFLNLTEIFLDFQKLIIINIYRVTCKIFKKFCNLIIF